MPQDHTETTTTRRDGTVATKSIQGRALDPSGELAVQEKMRTTDLGALARAAAAKKSTPSTSKKDTQKKALTPEGSGQQKKSSTY